VPNETERSKSRQRSTDGIQECLTHLRSIDGIEECLSQWRRAEKRWVRSAESIIGAAVGIEELPSWAEKHGKRGIECGMG